MRWISCSILALVAFSTSEVRGAVTNLTLKASTDKANAIDYVEGEPIRFDFFLDGVTELPAEVATNTPLSVKWTRAGDDGTTTTGRNAISLSDGFSITTSLSVPGFVRVTAQVVGANNKALQFYDRSSGKTMTEFVFGAGVATEKMRLSTAEPADFDDFWADAKAKLAAVPFGESTVELTEVFPNSTATNTYRYYAAKIPSLGRPAAAVTGWLTIPRDAQPGTLAAKATFDGYSVAIAKPALPTDRPGTGVMLFHVNAHGYDMVGQDAQYYRDFINLVNPPSHPVFPNSSRPYSHGLDAADYDNPTNAYFYFMALRVVRAFDYLKSRPEWNGRDLIAEGGSQGGLQTMWAGSLVDGISSIRPYITWGCDIGNYLNTTGPLLSNTWGMPNVPGAYYFDSALHAKRVPTTCIAEITRLGLGDYTCPPRGVLLSYYNMRCAASATLVQGSDHSYTPPAPNQTFTLSKTAIPDDPPGPTATATDAAGFDWTNRVITVSGLPANETLTLVLSAPDGTHGGAAPALASYTATADTDGVATFDVSTIPGSNYVYTVSQDGATIASGSFVAGGWDAEGSWFLARPDGQGGSTEVNGTWRIPPAGTNAASYAMYESSAFALAPDAIAVGSNRIIRVETGVTYAFLRDASDPDAPSSLSGSLAVIAATTNAADSAAIWQAYLGGQWVTLSGAIAPEPGTPYVIRLEGDFTLAAPRLRFSVSDDGGATFAALSDAASGAEWLVPGNSGKRSLAEVATEGFGNLAGISGELAHANVATADGAGYATLGEALSSGKPVTLLTNATWPSEAAAGTVVVNRGDYALVLPPSGVSVEGGSVVVSAGLCTLADAGTLRVTFADLARIGVVTAGKTPDELAAALAQNGANGIPKWQSYVLGLDAGVAASLPLADISAEGGAVVVAPAGINVNEDAGAIVTYRVVEIANLAHPELVTPVGDSAVALDESVHIDASANARFFRIKISITLP